MELKFFSRSSQSREERQPVPSMTITACGRFSAFCTLLSRYFYLFFNCSNSPAPCPSCCPSLFCSVSISHCNLHIPFFDTRLALLLSQKEKHNTSIRGLYLSRCSDLLCFIPWMDKSLHHILSIQKAIEPLGLVRLLFPVSVHKQAHFCEADCFSLPTPKIPGCDGGGHIRTVSKFA